MATHYFFLLIIARDRVIRNSYFRIHSYEMYSLGRLLLLTVGRPYKTMYLFQIFQFSLLSEIVTYGYSLMRCIHWAVCFSSTGDRWACPTKPSIDFWLFFVSKFRICPLFTEVSWNEMLGNALSGIVTLEYTLMRCILWAVCFL